MNDEELQANESAVQSSTSPASGSSIQARLATLFPTVGSNRTSRKDTIRRPAKSKRTIKSIKGRPGSQDTCLQGQSTTHTTRLQLEERELVCHELPFGKSWDANSLKTANLNRFPQLLLFEYVKVAKLPLECVIARTTVLRLNLSLRWLKTVSSTFQDVDFDRSLLPLLIS